MRCCHYCSKIHVSYPWYLIEKDMHKGAIEQLFEYVADLLLYESSIAFSCCCQMFVGPL